MQHTRRQQGRVAGGARATTHLHRLMDSIRICYLSATPFYRGDIPSLSLLSSEGGDTSVVVEIRPAVHVEA